jgi:hypothetical protein
MSARAEQRAVTTARRIAGRERAILRALYDHKILLTAWIKVLFFRSARRCQDQLRKLSALGLVERDDPSQPIGVGRAQGQWTLTEDGVQVVAVEMRKPRSSLDWMPRSTWHASDPLLEHQLGVNRFFVSLVEASLSHPDHGLEKWIPERYHSTMVAGAWVKPDGFGRYQHPNGACDFYLEFDRGTEWQRQLQEKLWRYVTAAENWAEGELEHFPNLLVAVPTESREAAFEKALRQVLDAGGIAFTGAVGFPFFIASEDLLEQHGVLGKVWRKFVPSPPNRPLAGRFLAERMSLVELPARQAGPYDLSKCLGRAWTNDSAVDDRRRTRPRATTFPAGDPPRPDDEPVPDSGAESDSDPSGGGEAA